nr:immunoglobulin heavy chain junction region [Mus musculus]MBK4183731.1 immunoglobulin heavy chain junction region [Mus musculus]MBK4183732.1 immunoglobulin heavy chain junction region [Mus musculus]MBK4185595.1 immunoglobulin heavy chain junction region [Mus musculus]MBK4196847.1 immunoglobulin heavy chain junction region [Mus musculus]
CTRGYYFDYW